MRDFASRILVGARRTLAALAVLTIVGVASPSASAALVVSFDAFETSGGTHVMGSATGTDTLATVGGAGSTENFFVSVTSNATDTTTSSTLSTTTFTLKNVGSGTGTLHVMVVGQNYDNIPTSNLQANFTTSGTSATHTDVDTTTNSSYFNPTNAATTAGATLIGSLTGTPTPSGPLAGVYVFPNGGVSPTIGVTASGAFSLLQGLDITLGAGDSATLTITTTVLAAVPEPSSMALAGLGAMGMIGYGLRRRKALGV
jgi:hypothetical protein